MAKKLRTLRTDLEITRDIEEYAKAETEGKVSQAVRELVRLGLKYIAEQGQIKNGGSKEEIKPERAIPRNNAELTCLELFRQFEDPIKTLEGMRWNLIAEKKDLLSNISKTVDLSQEKTTRPAKKRPHTG